MTRLLLAGGRVVVTMPQYLRILRRRYRARNIAVRGGAALQKDVLRHAASGSISVYIADPMTGISFEFCTEHEIVDHDHRARILEGSPITRDVWMAGTSKEEVRALTDAAMGVTSTIDGDLADIANTLA